MFGLLVLAAFSFASFAGANIDLLRVDKIYSRCLDLEQKEQQLFTDIYNQVSVDLDLLKQGNACDLKMLCWNISKLKTSREYFAQACMFEERLIYLKPNLDTKLKQVLYADIKLSLIVPTFNRASTVGQALDAACRQKYNCDFECIVVDDCSTDDTAKVLSKYQKKYNNLFVFRNPINKRAPYSRNRAIMLARGQYICNVDSDDVWSRDAVAKLLRSMIDNGCEMGLPGKVKFFKDYDLRNSRTMKTKNEGVITLENVGMQKDCIFGIGNRLFTKELWFNVGGYLEERGHDSWAFSYLALLRGFKIFFDKDIFYHHRTWSNSSSMWDADNRENVNHISPLRVLEMSSFMIDDMQFVRSYKGEEFFSRVLSRPKTHLKFKPEAYTFLDGLRYFRNKQYALALQAFRQCYATDANIVYKNYIDYLESII